jgi:hypothetical protein
MSSANSFDGVIHALSVLGIQSIDSLTPSIISKNFRKLSKMHRSNPDVIIKLNNAKSVIMSHCDELFERKSYKVRVTFNQMFGGFSIPSLGVSIRMTDDEINKLIRDGKIIISLQSCELNIELIYESIRDIKFKLK